MQPSWRTAPAERMFWGNTLPNDAVTIRGSTRTEGQAEGEHYRQEIRGEDYLRTIHLPTLVDDTKARATLHDGVLKSFCPS
jgi:HSP20 family molecular chaperone IbpA